MLIIEWNTIMQLNNVMRTLLNKVMSFMLKL